MFPKVNGTSASLPEALVSSRLFDRRIECVRVVAFIPAHHAKVVQRCAHPRRVGERGPHVEALPVQLHRLCEPSSVVGDEAQAVEVGSAAKLIAELFLQHKRLLIKLLRPIQVSLAMVDDAQLPRRQGDGGKVSQLLAGVDPSLQDLPRSIPAATGLIGTSLAHERASLTWFVAKGDGDLSRSAKGLDGRGSLRAPKRAIAEVVQRADERWRAQSKLGGEDAIPCGLRRLDQRLSEPIERRLGAHDPPDTSFLNQRDVKHFVCSHPSRIRWCVI